MQKLISTPPRNINSKGYTVKKLLQSKDEEDLKIGAIIASKTGLLKEIMHETEDVELYDQRMSLELWRAIQTKYPYMHIGGSVALFLHGVRLERWKETYYKADLDIVSPYWTDIEIAGQKASLTHRTNPSGGDFEDTYWLMDTKIDLAIDNKEKYEVIDYNGFNYKVGPINSILVAKIKYSNKGDQKHTEDIEEMIGKRFWSTYLNKVNTAKKEEGAKNDLGF